MRKWRSNYVIRERVAFWIFLIVENDIFRTLVGWMCKKGMMCLMDLMSLMSWWPRRVGLFLPNRFSKLLQQLSILFF